MGIGHGEDFGEQGFGGETHEGADFQGGTMGGSGDFLHKLFQQGFDDVGGGFGLKADVGALGEEVGDEGEGQGVAVGEGEHRGVLVGGDSAFYEVGAALIGAKVAQGEGVH